MPSEQPREGEARVDWPAKPQRGECVVGDSVWWSHDWNGNGTRCFRCGYKPALPSEQPPTRVEEAARALDKVIWLTDDVPHEVLVPARELHEALLNEPDKPALAQPQPREGSYNEQADRVFSEQPRGEGDDLAARLDGDRLQEWFTEIQASASLLPEDLEIIEAMIARASTHPEQPTRVRRAIDRIQRLYTRESSSAVYDLIGALEPASTPSPEQGEGGAG